MTSVPTSIIERIQKLLSLTQSSNQHEAAVAAAKAADLMRKYEISEAMLNVGSGGESEAIAEGQIAGTKRAGKRVTWKGEISGGVAKAYGVIEWWRGGAIMGVGRTSAVQSWQYTCQYLYREVDRLADEAWEAYPTTIDRATTSVRSWKNAFRVGAGVVISKRLHDQYEVQEAARRVSVEAAVCEQAEQTVTTAATTSTALAIIDRIDRDRAEVEQAFKERSANFGRNPQRQVTVDGDGYRAGRAAGATIELNRTGPALAAPTKQIKE